MSGSKTKDIQKEELRCTKCNNPFQHHHKKHEWVGGRFFHTNCQPPIAPNRIMTEEEMNPKPAKWEKDFDTREFHIDPDGQVPNAEEHVKDFIRQLLAERRKEVLGSIPFIPDVEKASYIAGTLGDWDKKETAFYIKGYNDCRKDIIAKLQENE